MAFYVGQKVVCVDAGCEIAGWHYAPVLGETYTVVDFVFDPLAQSNVVGLAEIKNCDWCNGRYRASRFRPVVERKTDISIFTRMLQPAKKAAETVGFLAFMAAVCVGVQFYQFLEMQ